MGKHTLEIEYDYDFLLIGISSHEKDYRLCWAVNNKLGIELSKQESLEIKGKKQLTPSYFSFFLFEDQTTFKQYVVVANFSESKTSAFQTSNLFEDQEKHSKANKNEIEYLIPEQKAMNYFFIIRGEIHKDETEEILNKLKEINTIQTAVRIDINSLKTKQNLVF